MGAHDWLFAVMDDIEAYVAAKKLWRVEQSLGAVRDAILQDICRDNNLSSLRDAALCTKRAAQAPN
jgi:hypothetical protein